jgi:hypothetical protein
LHDADQHIEFPGWIGAEVTGQSLFYNSSLAQRPFCSWSQQLIWSALGVAPDQDCGRSSSRNACTSGVFPIASGGIPALAKVIDD